MQVRPLASAGTAASVARVVDAAVAGRSRVLLGGRRPDRTSHYYPPKPLTGMAPDAPVLDRERSVPVAPVVTSGTLAEVVRFANATETGLAAYVHGRHPPDLLRVAERLEAGGGDQHRCAVRRRRPVRRRQAERHREGGGRNVIGEFLETEYVALAW